MVWFKNLQMFNPAVKCEWPKCLEKIYSYSIFQEVSRSIIQISKTHYSSDTESAKVLTSKSNKSSSDVVPYDKKFFSDKLIEWAIQNNISYIAFSQLLKVLSDYGLKGLPKNSRALLKAKEDEIKVSTVPPGTYTHFGLEKNLRNIISNLIEKNVFHEKSIKVSIFIDNLPFAKITQRGLWVILGSVVGFSNIVFFIGAYHGYSKPNNPNLFLSEFVEEAKHLSVNGLEINKEVYKVEIKRLICDAPAKAFVLNIKNFGGYSSCTKCHVTGEYINKTVCFHEECTLKTDEDYRNCNTKLLEIPSFGIVSNVPLDYMHLVCLGVVKKLLGIWLSNEEHWVSKDSAINLLKLFSSVCPCEFQKKPKSLYLFSRWNGNEFRQFLLYYGPIVLRNNLKEVYYSHFLLLHVACRLLCMRPSPENIDRGRELLNTFVKTYKKLYKEEQITHNVHGLYHLANDCFLHGTLDDFSSFPFELFLLKLKNSMKKTRKRSVPQVVLQQSYEKVLSKSLQKVNNKQTTNCLKAFKKLKTNDNELKSALKYERLLLRNFEIIPHLNGNNYVRLKNDKVVEVSDVIEKKEKSTKVLLIAGKEFTMVSNFYSESFADLKLDMYKVEQLSEVVTLWPAEMIENKYMKVPIGNEQIVLIGLLETNF